MEKLLEVLTKNNFKRRKENLISTFDEIENSIDFILPDDYKLFLTTYLSYEDFIGPEYVRLWELTELIELNSDYAILENLPKTIGIGSNGAGEFIAIEKSVDNSARVILSPFIDLDSQYHIEIGISFTDFIERLDSGKTWFEEDVQNED